MKLNRILVACTLVFALCSLAFAAEYWVIREGGKMVIVETKPADVAVIVKGPFPTRAEAEIIITGPMGGAVVIPKPGPPVDSTAASQLRLVDNCGSLLENTRADDMCYPELWQNRGPSRTPSGFQDDLSTNAEPNESIV